MRAGAYKVREVGGPEVMQWKMSELPEPGPGQILVQHNAIGFNFIDTYHRSGRYPLPLPTGLGTEAVGTVKAVGSGVRTVRRGERVAHINQIGAYSEAQIIPADRAIPVPDEVDDKTAAAIVLKGITAHYLTHRAYKIKKGDAILIHAAAGGVGLLVCQWAAAIGAKVIGTVSSEEKARLIRNNGCGFPIVTTKEKFIDRVKELTNGEGVHVVYDSVGRDTWDDSMKCLRRLGTLVSFGSASGLPDPIDIGLMQYSIGSPFITRAALVHYTATRAELLAGARAIFQAVTRGIVHPQIGRTYPLSQAAQAHRDAEARITTGSIVLLPLRSGFESDNQHE